MQNKKPNILIIEDNEILGEILTRYMKHFGYDSDLVTKGEEGLKEARAGKHDLLLLDIALPEINGFNIVRKLKAGGFTTPIIIITEDNNIANEKSTYKLEANLFHPKPIKFDLLEVQIKGLLKNSGNLTNRLSFGAFVLDIDQRVLQYKKKTLKLTPKELRLLLALGKKAGTALDRNQLINNTFTSSNDRTYASIDTLVSRLRRKIIAMDNALDSESLIETVHGFGYKISMNKS